MLDNKFPGNISQKIVKNLNRSGFYPSHQKTLKRNGQLKTEMFSFCLSLFLIQACYSQEIHLEHDDYERLNQRFPERYFQRKGFKLNYFFLHYIG